MRIGIDIRALSGRRAGKGWLVYRLLKALGSLPEARAHHFVLYARRLVTLDFPLPDNFQLRLVPWPGSLWHLAVALEINISRRIDCYFSPTSFIVPALAPRRCVLLVNDLVALKFPAGHNRKAVWIEKLMMKPALREARRVVAISKSTKRDLQQYFPTVKDKTNVVYLAGRGWGGAVTEEDKQRVAEKYQLPNIFLFFLGTLEPRKNLVRLIEAFNRIKDEYRGDLVIGGQRGWQWAEIFETVKRLNLGSRVHFLGYVPGRDAGGLYSLADLFVFPSLYEGFGLPVLEAMEFGCPVVTSNVSSLPEVAGDAAVLVDPQRVDDIIRGIREAQTRKPELIARGHERARRFSWAKTAHGILAVITGSMKDGK